MPRRRPELKDWDDSFLRKVDVSDPEEWVGTVLNSYAPTKTNPYPKGPPRVWTFGEIREAIRRELVRRGMPEKGAFHLASLRTLRGLKALDDEGDLRKSAKGYSIPERSLMAEAICMLTRQLARGNARYRTEVLHLGPDKHGMEISFKSRSGLSVVATIR